MTSIPLPDYPDFKAFTYTDVSWYDKFSAKFLPYADFYSGNMRVWLDINGDLELSRLGASIVYRFTSVLDNNTVTTTLLGKDNIDGNLDRLLGDISRLSFVPLEVVQGIHNPDNYLIEPERESFDYILSSDLLNNLEGSRVRSLRQGINFAYKNYAANVSTHNEKLTSKHWPKLNEWLSRWAKVFTLTSNNEGSYEMVAMARNTQLAQEVSNYLWTIYIGGQLEGFVIYHQMPQEEYITINHVKTGYRYKFVFDFILHRFAKDMQAQGILFMNLEQDLGLEGLRTHKLKLKPVRLLEKYSIRQK